MPFPRPPSIPAAAHNAVGRYLRDAVAITIHTGTSKPDMTSGRVRWSRWRIIGTFTGCLLVMLLCTYLLVPGGTSMSDGQLSVRPQPARVDGLSNEEMAMFGQYQAVGLGNNTLEAAYSPVPRQYVSPPHGDIYSTFGVVMASFGPHSKMLSRFFDSMSKFCLDCHRVRIVVIIPCKEAELFEEIRAKHISKLPGLEMVPFTQVFPALNETLAVKTPGWPEGWMGWNEERLLKDKDRLLLQSFKKVYGCLHLAREYCMVLDSEGFFIRNATLAAIYGGFRKSPYVVYSSHLRHTYFATDFAHKILGYQEEFGWALEEYNWVLDTNIVAEIERIFREKRPTLDQMEKYVFVEVVYWIYQLHNRHKYPRLRVLDTANLFGIRTLEHMRQMANYDDKFFTPFEDLRWYMEKDPALVDVAVNMFRTHGFKMLKTSGSKQSIELLERATSIVLCVSEQPDNVYEMAMSGHFTARAKAQT